MIAAIHGGVLIALLCLLAFAPSASAGRRKSGVA
jgi:hypothetical protein